MRRPGTRLAAALVVGASAGLLTFWGSIALAGHEGSATDIEQHDLGYSYSVDVDPPEWGTPLAVALGLVAAAGTWAVVRRRTERRLPR